MSSLKKDIFSETQIFKPQHNACRVNYLFLIGVEYQSIIVSIVPKRTTKRTIEL